MTSAAKLRVFAALELPPAARQELGRVMGELKALAPVGTVRWVRPEGIHLTVKFYGEVTAPQVQALEQRLAEAAAGAAAIQLALGDVGAFPKIDRPRVIWVGVDGAAPALNALAEAVETNSQALGFEREARGFHPHLTLGRVVPQVRPADLRRLSQTLAGFRPVRGAPFELSRLSLMRSQPGPGGSIYSAVWTAPLGGPNAAAMIKSRPSGFADQEESRSEPD